MAGYTLANGIAHSLTQNVRGLPLVNRDAGVLQDLYGYDQNGNVASITDQQEAVFNRTLGYDDLDRLTSASAPGVWGTASYAYDPVDNLRAATVGSRSTVLSFGANNQLASVTTNGVLANYGFDARGNLTAKGAQTFGFDLGNRLTTSSLGGSYAYDGHGRRFRVVSTDGSTRMQLYSQAGQILWATSTGGARPTSTTAYIYLGGKAIAEANSVSGTQYLHTDALGSPVARTNTAGAVINRTRYEPYGYVASGVKPSPSVGALGFTGHVQDAETDLVYMQQRYYDPWAGRFLSVDPIVTDANAGTSFGRYMYVENNPYAKVDPNGAYSCGDSLTSEQCTTAMSNQATAIRKLEAGVKMVGAIMSAIKAGKSLTAEQTSFSQKIDKVAGDGASKDVSLLEQMSNAGNNSLADLRSNIKLELDNSLSGKYAVHANDSVKLSPQYFTDSKKIGSATLMHEGFHRRGAGYLMDRNYRPMPADPEMAAKLRFEWMGRQGALMDADTMTVLFGGYSK